jgi:large repetitive protein
MFTSMRTARALLALAALSLSGCAKLLGDFTYDPNPPGAGQGGSGAGGGGSGDMQGDIVVMPPNGLVTTEQGAKATFTIALKVQPTADVKVDLQSSNELEGIVSPLSVSFTPDNYAAPQMVQVTGADDMEMDGTQAYKIITAAAVSDDAHYSGLDPIDPELKNVDDETAGFLVTPTTGLVTSESGREATFTVVLTRAPTADVAIPLRSEIDTEGTISPKLLTFTPTNWMAPQVVTVTGVDDAAPDRAQNYRVITSGASSNDQDYDKLDPDDVAVTNLDNDSAGVTLTPATGLLTYEDENGSMATFGIALNSPPTKDVTIALSTSDDTEGVVAPAQVVFTSLNWMASQLVTVTGKDDGSVDGNQPYLVVTAPAQSEDLEYADFDGPDAEVINVDDDSPGLVVMTSAVPLTTSELGASNTFTVALASEPKGDVLLDVVSSRTPEGVVAPALLTFTVENWRAPQVVTVTGVNDKVADGPQPYLVHVKPKPESADADYAKVLETDVSFVNIDDDSPGVTVVAAAGLTTTEGGGTATFTVVLYSQPTADVKVGLSSSNTAEGTVSPATLVFTPANYAAPQLVTIKGVNDDVQDGTQPYKIITAPADSKDPNYASIDASNVDVKNSDDDSAGINVSAASLILSTSEGGGTATFTVVLHSQPAAADVTIPITSNNLKEGTVTPASLKFTRDNWRAPQTVTIKGVDDDGTADGSQPYRVVLGKATSADANYNVIDPPDVNVTNTDNESAGISLRNQNGLTTKENAMMASFLVVLNSRPMADVAIAISSSNTKEGTVTPSSLKFTSANWNAPQTVTVTGANDDVADGNQVYRVITGAAQSSDPKYNGMDPADASVTNTDDDSPGISVVFTPSTGLSTREDGTSASFTLVLDSQPTADVTIPVRSSNTKEGTVNPASVTFTAANWRSPRTITLTGVDDNADDGAQPYTVIVDPATSTDAKYKGMDAPDVPATNVDNDSAGINVSPISGDTNEDGTTANFTVALSSEPKADVTIPLTSSNVKEGTVSPASVTFTPINWKSAQKITITPINDLIADGPQPVTIDIGPSTSNDGNYKGLTAPAVALSNIDDDSAGITITPVKGKTSESGTTTTFTIKLNSQPTADVTIPLSSSNPSEGTLSVTQVAFTSVNYGSATTVTITGVDDEDERADGEQPYSILVGPAVSTDQGYKGMTAPAVPVINADNDSAGLTVSAMAGGETGEKPSAKAYTFTIALTSKPSANVTIPITSSDVTEGTVSPASLVFTTTNWKAIQTVTVTGVDDEMVDGPQSYKVRIGAATSTDEGYSGFDYPTDISLTNLDDDSAGIEVSPAAGSTSEKGATFTFTIVLSLQPSADVTIPLSSSNEKEGIVDVTSVVFTTANWNKPVTVTVTGVNDTVADGPQKYWIRTGAAVSSAVGYKNLDADDVEVTNDEDDDMAGIQVSAAPGLTTTEAGGTATFTVVLSSQPKAPVSIAIASDTPTEGVPNKTKVDFTTSNWSVPQTVTVTGVDDAIVDGSPMYKIVLSKPTSTDTAYAAIDPADVSLTNTDDDIEVAP